MNYYKSGLYNKKLEQAYSYDKKKKELKDEQGNKRNNTTERSREEKKEQGQGTKATD